MDIKEATRKRLKELGISVEGLNALLKEQSKKNTVNHAPLNEEQSDIALEIKVKNIMHRLGGPAHIKGHQYTADAIIMVVNDKNVIKSMTKCVYPGVAEKNNATPKAVERSIRHWIAVAWSRSTEEEQSEFFGASVSPLKSKPTNSEFIATIADYILMGGE